MVENNTGKKKYYREEIATQQLKMAVILFLNKKDLSSVITLAGAAGNILNELVKRSGKEPVVGEFLYLCGYGKLK